MNRKTTALIIGVALVSCNRKGGAPRIDFDEAYKPTNYFRCIFNKHLHIRGGAYILASSCPLVSVRGKKFFIVLN